MVVFFELEQAMGEVDGTAVTSSSTELECMEMEAAEQLIQLSGSYDDDAGGGGGESESRSTDSVKSCKAATAGEKIDKEVTMESTAAKRYGRFGAGNDSDDEAVIGGGARRKRPRFRSLAAIYRETRRLSGDGCREAEEDERRRKRKKTARDGAGDEVIRPPACNRRRVLEP